MRWAAGIMHFPQVPRPVLRPSKVIGAYGRSVVALSSPLTVCQTVKDRWLLLRPPVHGPVRVFTIPSHRGYQSESQLLLAMPRYFTTEKGRTWHDEQEGSWRFAQR